VVVPAVELIRLGIPPRIPRRTPLFAPHELEMPKISRYQRNNQPAPCCLGFGTFVELS
jgi:hypothetical protein